MLGRGLVLGLLFSILLTGVSFSPFSFAAAGDPTVDVGPDDTIDEGDIFSSSGSITDPTNDDWDVEVDYGDGNSESIIPNPDGTFDFSHTYAQDSDLINGGPFEVVVTISNGTYTDVDSLFVTVNNVLPSIASISDTTIDEGDTFSIIGSFTDPGDDAWTAGVTWEDMQFDNSTITPGKTFDLNHIFTKDGIFPVSVVVSDGPNSNSTETFTVTVKNIPPVLTLGPGATINQGDTFTTTGSFTDPGDDSWTVSVDFGDGTVEDIAFNPDKTFELSHVFKQVGTFSVSVTVDDGLVSDTKTTSVTVDNVDPTVDAGEDGTLDEGDTFTSSGTISDPSGVLPSIVIDYGDGTTENITPNPDGTFDFSHTYTNDDDFTLTITADDGDGGIVTDSATVTVNNVLPEIVIESQSVDDDRLFTATGSFIDPGSDTWTATVDYDDGDGPQSLTLSGKTFSLSHSYSVNGVYDVAITVSEIGGASTITTLMVGVFVSDTTLPSDLNSPVFTTQMLTNAATFSTSNQDIWGPVTGGSGTSSWNLFNPQHWDESDGDSAFTTLAGKRLGAGVSVGTNGHLIMTGSASDLSGKTGVNYPGNVKITHPDADSFLAGESVPVSGVWTLDENNAKILAGKTMGDLRMDFDIALEAFIDTEVCILVGCEDLFVIPDIDFDTGKTKLFSITDAGDVDIPDSLTGFLGLDISNLNPIMVQPSTTSVSNGKIIAESTNKFADIVIDIDKIATHMGLAPPLGRNLSSDGVGFSYDFFDADAIIDFKARQKLTFDTGVLIKLDFSRPVTGVTGNVFAFTEESGKVKSVTYREGEQVNIIFPQGETDPITVTPTLLLDSSKTRLHQFTEVITESDVNMKSLESSMNVPGFTVVPAIPIYDPIPHLSGWECHGILCIDGHFHHGPHWHKIGETPAVKFNGINFNVGPAWNSGPQGQEIKKDVVANKAFALGGFNTVTLSSFELNPEVPPTAEANGPYEVLEGSIVELTGTGEDLDGDALTFAWDFDGDMTFETIGATVDYPLGIDGPDTLSAELQVCDDLNCDEDFATITVINVAPTVDAGIDETIDEGSLFTRTINFEDPGADTWDIEIDYGDGFTESLTTLSERTFDLSHTYADNDSYTISITITDDDAGVDSDSFVVTVNNVNPTVEAGEPDTVDEGALYSYVATFTDPGFDCETCGTLEDFTATVDWGDNTGVEPLTVNETAGSPGVLTQGTASGNHIYRLPGDYTVTVTVTDDDTGANSDTFVTTVLGAQDLKNRAISFLTPYDSEKDVEKAIESIEDSLDSKYWTNNVYLDEKYGKKVFDEEKKAVKDLQKILKDGAKKGIDPTFAQVTQDSIDLLVNADRVLAITIMLDSTSTPADDPKKQDKVDKENEKSAEEFAKADQKRDEGDYDKAIDHYKKAWDHAQKALKHANK